jgi:hypothetical protein
MKVARRGRSLLRIHSRFIVAHSMYHGKQSPLRMGEVMISEVYFIFILNSNYNYIL